MNYYSRCKCTRTFKKRPVPEGFVFVDFTLISRQFHNDYLQYFDDNRKDEEETDEEASLGILMDMCHLASLRTETDFTYVPHRKDETHFEKVKHGLIQKALRHEDQKIDNEELKWIPNDIDDLSTLRHGNFGHEFLAHHKQKSLLIAKLKLVSPELHEDTFFEIKLWSKISEHPNVTSFLGYFTNLKSLGVLSEYKEGVSLYFYIKKCEKLSWNISSVICAQIALALIFIHNKGIFHRNVNTSCIKLCSDGLVQIDDFDKAVVNKSNKIMKGIWQYCAPEAFEQKYYNNKVSDWYVFGICIYEMTIGLTPLEFYCKLKNINFEKLDAKGQRVVALSMEVYLLNSMDKSTAKILTRLLEKNLMERLGYGDELSDFKKESFFQNINWKLLNKGKLKASFENEKYDVKSLLDSYLRYESKIFYY